MLTGYATSRFANLSLRKIARQVVGAFCQVLLASGLISVLGSPKKVDLPQLNAAVLFREVADKPIERWIPFLGDEVPGYDHIALLVDGIVYETHPGYGMGHYLDAEGRDSIFVDYQCGVQWQHTLHSFAFNSREISNSQVIDFIAVPIDPTLASQMLCSILSVSDRPYTFINYTIESLLNALAPSVQKGGRGNFTCVGLMEWAAEQAGYNQGMGFICDRFESLKIPHPWIKFKSIEIPALSPQLFYLSMRLRGM